MGAPGNPTIAVTDGRHAAPRAETGRLGDLATLSLAAVVVAFEIALLIAIWDPGHWEPLSLLVVLTAFMIFGEVFAVRVGRIYVTSTVCATVLAMALLGPVPAAVIAGVGCIADWLVNRKAAWAGISNMAESTLAVLAGALFVETVGGDVENGEFALTVFLAGVLNAAVNLLLLAAVRRIRLGASLRHDLAISFLPTVPFHLLGIALGTAAAQIAVAGDFPVLAAVLPALLVSEYLMRAVAAQYARSEEVMRLTKERANLLEQALTAEVAEREWIAGHVHDETLQTLAVVRQELDEASAGDAEAVGEARAHLDRATEELRRTLAHVHPGAITRHGLEAALRSYAAQVLGRRGIEWQVDVAAAVGEEHQALLYSLARELLGNAAKHAQATEVTLSVSRHGDRIRLSVSDDGGGFAPGATEAPGHFGLLTVRHRVTAADGTLTIADGPGGHVVIELPA